MAHEPVILISDPLLLELHLVSEIQEVFVRKWTPRFMGTLDESDDLVTLLAHVTSETDAIQAAVREVLGNWVASTEGSVRIGAQAMRLSRKDFVRNLGLFKGASADILHRCSVFAPTGALADRLHEAARMQRHHADLLSAWPGGASKDAE